MTAHTPNAPMPPAMELALCASFGSMAHWRDGFAAMGQAAGGQGWLRLGFLPAQGRLINQWATERHTPPDGATPLLDIDLQALARPQ